MRSGIKVVLAVLMLVALFFGYMDRFFADSVYSFERLHVFLFNLCCGGSVLIYYTIGKKEPVFKNMLFFILSLVYAVLAFFELYIPAVAVSLVLALIVEQVRAQRFSFFPSFFSRKVPVFIKFHQASLLCLSLALIISACVTVNNEYLKIVTMPKLELDTFFLGFSFPISLITMSVMFGFMNGSSIRISEVLKESGFWMINLGVIVFFIFIIFEQLLLQLVTTLILFAAVVMIMVLYKRTGSRVQQKEFLTSGIGFLLVTAVTGIVYILFEFSDDYTPDKLHWLLKLHVFASLYGWNICGLSVICRFHDFPIRLNSGVVIALHWCTALFFAPLGMTNNFFVIVALVCYGLVLYWMLFSKGKELPPYFRKEKTAGV